MIKHTLRYVRGSVSRNVVNAVEALNLLCLNVVGNANVLEKTVELAFKINIELLNKFKNTAKKVSQIVG